MALKRLQREYMSLMKEPIPVGTVTPDPNDPFLWMARMIGPEGSPYENGFIEVELLFSEQYPNRAPRITFKNNFYHANVESGGNLCFSLFQNWRSTDTVTTIMLAITDLFSNPNRNSAYQGRGLSDADYFEECRKWTQSYGMI